MQTRTLYALLLATLLAVSATVVAEGNETATTNEKPAYPNFVLKVSPSEAWVKPGEAATFSVVSEARSEKHLTLAIRAPDGLRAALSSETLDVFPGSAARASLTVAAPENATRSPYYVVVIGTAEDGTVRESKAVIHLRELAQKTGEAKPVEKKEDPRPAATASDAKDHRYDILERKFLQILERLDRIEKRLDRLEERAAKPKPEPTHDRPAVRMTLSPEHAVIGPEGGKVALLFAGGAKDLRVPIALRYNDTSGWKIGLEQDVVFVPAHERAWIWVTLTPPAAAADASNAAPSTIEYAIVQPDSQGPYVTKGTATARMP